VAPSGDWFATVSPIRQLDPDWKVEADRWISKQPTVTEAYASAPSISPGLVKPRRIVPLNEALKDFVRDQVEKSHSERYAATWNFNRRDLGLHSGTRIVEQHWKRLSSLVGGPRWATHRQKAVNLCDTIAS
jgi:hypothetical protein